MFTSNCLIISFFLCILKPHGVGAKFIILQIVIKYMFSVGIIPRFDDGKFYNTK